MSEQNTNTGVLQFTPEFNVVVKDYIPPESIKIEDGEFTAVYHDGVTKNLKIEAAVVNGKLIIDKQYSYTFTDDGNGNITVTREEDDGE